MLDIAHRVILVLPAASAAFARFAHERAPPDLLARGCARTEDVHEAGACGREPRKWGLSFGKREGAHVAQGKASRVA